MQSPTYFQDLLSEELARRCGDNPRYSTRAFAKALDVDVASLSRILSGKQVPSYKICQKLFTKLELSPQEQKRFLLSVAASHKSRGIKRISPEFRTLSSLQGERENIATDLWRSIADWYHGAILELTFVEGFQSDPEWIAHTLGISVAEAKAAINRLLRLKLLKEERGVLKKAHDQIASDNKKVTTPAHRKLQKQVLSRAITSLENDPIEIRNMTSMTMAIDPELVPRAKEMIQEFSRELCAFLESGKRSQVYQLGVCLYPISKIEGK